MRGIIKNYINETDISFHVGKLPENPKPYGGGTDNLFMMSGRGTGHFGSGVYLSTYTREGRYEKFNKEYYKNYDALTYKGKPYIHTENNLYIFDLDRYELYRTKNFDHANLLFKTLKMINNFFYLLAYFNKINKEDFAKIKENLDRLDLKLDKSFFGEIRELMKYYKIGKSEKMLPSLSTLFMEYNGYNGVNVNSITGYDNTEHGSVIYDINKFIDSPKKNPKYDSWEKEVTFDKIVNNFYYKNISNLSLNEINKILKLSPNFLNVFSLEYSFNKNYITKEQYEHILKIYPKILRYKNNKSNGEINESFYKEIYADTIYYYSEKSVYFDFDVRTTFRLVNDLIVHRKTKKKEHYETLINYLKLIENKLDNDRDKRSYDELMNEIKIEIENI